MRHQILWVLVAIMALFFGATISCDCLDDDDDNDDLLGGDDDEVTAEDCEAACEQGFECGAQFWWDTIEECVESCNEWREDAMGCADCFIDCALSDDSCFEIGICLSECALSACSDVLGDLI